MGQFLARWTSKQPEPEPEPSHNSLYDQPLDIIQEISDLLEPQSSVALALTCKGFHEHLSPAAFTRLRQACRDQQEAAIRLIEKDIGHRYHYCAICDDFHRWSPPSSPRAHPSRPQGQNAAYPEEEEERTHTTPECARPGGRACGLRPFRACAFDRPQDITYATCQLVMNRHFGGAPRGLPVRSLEVPARHTGAAAADSQAEYRLVPLRPGGCPSGHSRAWRARVIGDELYVSCVLRVDEFGPVMRGPGRGHCWGGGFRRRACVAALRLLTEVCDHGPRKLGVRLGSTRGGMSWRALPGKMFTCPSAAGPWDPSLVVRGSCRYCLADYEAEIFFRVGRSSRVVITSYHQLGSFRSTLDWKWVNAFRCPNRDGTERDVVVRHAELGTGPDDVRRRWVAHDNHCLYMARKGRYT